MRKGVVSNQEIEFFVALFLLYSFSLLNVEKYLIIKFLSLKFVLESLKIDLSLLLGRDPRTKVLLLIKFLP